MGSKDAGFSERFKRARIGLKDTLAVIDMTLEDQLGEFARLSPYEVFEGLNELTDRTLHGTKIERSRSCFPFAVVVWATRSSRPSESL
jgi:hypothetical protein